MTISQVGTLTSNMAFDATQTVTTPTGTSIGNVMFAIQFSLGDPSLLSPWTSILHGTVDSGGNYNVASCISLSGAPDADYTFTQASGANTAAIVSYAGVDTSTPFEQASLGLTSGSVPASVVPTNDNSIQVIWYTIDAVRTIATNPSDAVGTFTLLAHLSNSSFGDIAIYARALGAGTGGSTVTAPSTPFAWSAGSTNKSCGTFVIRPSASGRTPLVRGMWIG